MRKYQNGGQNEILQAIAQYLQQGASPEQILQALVQQGIPQEQAQQLIQQVQGQMQQQRMGGMMRPTYLQNGGITISPSKRGTFKAQASRMNMNVQEAANTILNAPEGRYSPLMRKKANFDRNFARQEGGESPQEQQAEQPQITADQLLQLFQQLPPQEQQAFLQGLQQMMQPQQSQPSMRPQNIQ